MQLSTVVSYYVVSDDNVAQQVATSTSTVIMIHLLLTTSETMDPPFCTTCVSLFALVIALSVNRFLPMVDQESAALDEKLV